MREARGNPGRFGDYKEAIMIKSLSLAATLCNTVGVDVEPDDCAANAEVEIVRERIRSTCIQRRGITTMVEASVIMGAQYRFAAEFVAWRRLAQAGLYADPATQRSEARAARDELTALGIDPNALPKKQI